MALIKCPTCNADISETAKFCPHCGEKRKMPLKFNPKIAIALGIILVIIFAASLFGGNSVKSQVKQLLKDDLSESISISELYYNEEKQACLVEFETKTTIDIAAIYLDTGKILYESDFDYYTYLFNTASSKSQRGKYSQKVLEYGDLASWQFTIAYSGANEKNGWKEIK